MMQEIAYDNVLDNFDDCKIINTKLPSYLKCFFTEDVEISLLHSKRSTSEISPLIKSEEMKRGDNEQSELDLTGNPLEVELGGNDSFENLPSEDTLAWSLEESKHFPLNLSRARSFINKAMRRSNVAVPREVFAVCDGKDACKTIILGGGVIGKSFIRTLVYDLGLIPSDDIITSIESMENDHLYNISYIISKYYNIFGCGLKNCLNLEAVEVAGNICLKLFSKDREFSNNINMSVTVEVILGHPTSPLIKYWKELSIIRRYIDLLTPNLNGEDSLCDDQDDTSFTLIAKEITNLFKFVTFLEWNNVRTFNLEDLRQECIADSLWNILQKCRNLSELQEGLYICFEEIAGCNKKLYIPEGNNSVLSLLINGICNGKMAVPKLSFCQALELLIDLGLDKLKCDYLAMFNHLHAIQQEDTLKDWRNLCENLPTTTELFRRKTAIIAPNTSIVPHSAIKQKYLYLNRLHKALEFMFLVKHHFSYLSPRNFDNFCESVCREFISVSKLDSIPNIQHLQLCEFSFSPSSFSQEFLQSPSVFSWMVELKSVTKFAEVITKFNFSKRPTFPHIIHSTGKNDGENKLFATKFIRYLNKN